MLTTDITAHCQYELLRQYCTTRDKYRTKLGQAPKWADVVPLSVKSSASFWGRKSQCLRAWDKSFTNGYNRAKTNHEAPGCSQCGHEDSLFHMCLQCPHQGIRDLREKAFDDQGTALSKILKDAPAWKRPLFTALRDLCWARVAQTPDETGHLSRPPTHAQLVALSYNSLPSLSYARDGN